MKSIEENIRKDIGILKEKMGVKGFLFICILLVLGTLFFNMQDIVTYYQKKDFRDKVVPEMLRLADTGNVSAINWLTQNYKADENQLKLAANTDNAESQYLYATYLFCKGKDAEARKMLGLAAENGNAEAIYLTKTEKYNTLSLPSFKH